MMSDLLNTCYSDYISISRPETSISSLNNSFDEEREPSPVHLSSAMSTSSRVTCFSQRLVELDKKKNDNKIRLAMGRGKGIEANLSQIDVSITKEKDNSIITNNITSSIPSIIDNSKFYFDNQNEFVLF
jgi:hypothetical protein